MGPKERKLLRPGRTQALTRTQAGNCEGLGSGAEAYARHRRRACSASWPASFVFWCWLSCSFCSSFDTLSVQRTCVHTCHRCVHTHVCEYIHSACAYIPPSLPPSFPPSLPPSIVPWS